MNTITRMDGWEKLEAGMVDWMDRRGATCMRLSLGVIFLWFGVLKLVPGFSPAEALVEQTMLKLTLGLVPGALSVPVLGFGETLLGLSFLTGLGLRYAILLLMIHMAGTALPFLFLPGVVFGADLPSLTLEGQYIVKNLVLISGALIVGARALRVGEGRLV